MFPKKRRATFIPVMIESKPPSIPDYARAQKHLDRATWFWIEGENEAARG